MNALSGSASPTAQRIFFANLVAQVAIVVTGGLVRLTGSGLGCPTWPQCVPGSFVPVAKQAESWHKLVEFGNRTLTFVLLILAVAALVAGIQDHRRRRSAAAATRPSLLALSAVPLVGTLAQAILGGITVLTDLHPATVASHFLLSTLVIGGCTVLVKRAGEPGDSPVTTLVRREIVWLTRALTAVGAVVIILGTVVTGSGPHSGDADEPARFGLDPRTISWLHADAVLLFIGLLITVVVALRLTDAPAHTLKNAYGLLAITVAQGTLGYAQYFLGLPWLMVACHMLLACVLWVALLNLNMALRSRGQINLTTGTDLPTAEHAS